MKRSHLALGLNIAATLAALLAIPSCGNQRKLVGLTIAPTTFTFGTPAGTEQLHAYGTYIHPPSTEDVTSQATWSIDDGVVSFPKPGLVTPVTGSCGGGTVTATLPEGTGGSSNIVTTFATVIVDNPSNPLCPGGGTVATLSVGVNGTGVVTSTPAGISCPGACVASYDVGASVLLTASGGNFTSWTNCSGTGNSCAVPIPSGGAAVIANFQ